MCVFLSEESSSATLHFLISFLVLIPVTSGDEIQYSHRLLVVGDPLRMPAADSQLNRLWPDVAFFPLKLISKSHFSEISACLLCFFHCLVQLIFSGSIFETILSDCWITHLLTAVDDQQESLKRKINKLTFLGLESDSWYDSHLF